MSARTGVAPKPKWVYNLRSELPARAHYSLVVVAQLLESTPDLILAWAGRSQVQTVVRVFMANIGPESWPDNFDTRRIRWATVLGCILSREEALNKYSKVEAGDNYAVQNAATEWDSHDWAGWAVFHLTRIAKLAGGPLHGKSNGVPNSSLYRRLWTLLLHYKHKRYTPAIPRATAQREAATERPVVGDVEPDYDGHNSQEELEWTAYNTSLFATLDKDDFFNVNTRWGSYILILSALKLLRDPGHVKENLLIPSPLLAADLMALMGRIEKSVGDSSQLDQLSETLLAYQRMTDGIFKEEASTGSTPLTEQQVDAYAALEQQLATGNFNGASFASCAGILPSLTKPAVGEDRGDGWRHHADDVNVSLLPWQITGAAGIIEIFRACTSGTTHAKGAILGDATGLGKSMQIAMICSTIADLTDAGYEGLMPKPMLLLVPSEILFRPMLKHLANLDKRLKLHVYWSELSTQTPPYAFAQYIKNGTLTAAHSVFTDEESPFNVVVSTFQTWAMRHGPAGRKKWEHRQQSKGLSIDVAWEGDLSCKFGLCVVDEAHGLKNPGSGVNQAVVDLEADFYLLSSATIFPNRLADDILGYLRVIQLNTCPGLWATANADDPSFNPYNDNCEAQYLPLRTSLLAGEKFISSNVDSATQAGRAVMALQDIMVRRQYQSVDPSSTGNRKIGDAMAKLVQQRVFVSFGTTAAEEHGLKCSELLEELYIPTGDGGVTFNGSALRRLHLICTNPRLDFVQAGMMANHIAAWRKVAHPLFDILKRMHAEMVKISPTHTAPFHLPQFDQRDKVAAEFMRHSPKAVALLQLVAHRVLFKGEKLLIVCANPASQIVVNALLQNFGISVCLFSSDMSTSQRSNAVDDFNREHGAMVIVTSYVFGSVGIDLQSNSHVIVTFDSAGNSGQETQAIGRLRRYGQTQVVEHYDLVAQNSWQMSFVSKNLDKWLAIAMADLALGTEMISEVGAGGETTTTAKLSDDYYMIGGVPTLSRDTPAGYAATHSKMTVADYVKWLKRSQMQILA